MNSYMAESDRNTTEPQINFKLLHKLPFFTALPEKAMKLIAYLAKRTRYSATDKIIEAGDGMSQASLVLSGELTLADTSSATRYLIKRFQQGDFIGSFSLLGATPALFELRAETEVELLQIKRKEFTQVLHQFPEIYPLILKATLKELHQWERKNMQQAEKCCLKQCGVTIL